MDMTKCAASTTPTAACHPNHARPCRAMSDAEPGSSTSSKARVPVNLRFQRRISERAFSETQYRDGTMDYPGAGTSPWASSPEASRTSFSNDVPREDLPGPALQHEGEAGASGAASSANGEEHQQQQNYSYGQAGSWSPEQQHQWQHQQAQQQQQQYPEQQQQPVRAPGEENRRPQSARYHGVPPQQRQHVPQYKLQAKIMGMERSGKKDPILKFDVHVRRCCQHPKLNICADCCLDQPAQVPDDPVPRHPSNAL